MMMNSKIPICLAFIFGTAIGSVTTWHCVKKKYERIAQEEIDSVKKVFLKRETSAVDANEEVKESIRKVPEKPPLADFVSKIQKEGYFDYSNGIASYKEEVSMEDGKPYVISPDEFGENEEYERISLTYFADHVLADENDEIVEDAEHIIGKDSLLHFGEYEDDSVFVRNDIRKCDYEILMDQRMYSDVVKRGPHRTEE